MNEKISEEIADVMFIARLAVFTALTFVITAIFSVYLPSTRGYFNFGEIGVYLSGLIGGPIIGAIAGGVGSMLSDVALGFPWYAPATLLIKGVEGGIVGLVGRKIEDLTSRKKITYVVLASVSLMSIYLLWLFVWFFKGFSLEVYLPSISLSPVKFTMNKFYTLHMSPKVGLFGILLLAVLLSLLAVYLITHGLYIYASCLVAGPFMVLGYFVYQAFILGYGIGAASLEIPFNIGQMVVGTLVSVPVFRYLQKAGLDVDN